MFKLDKYQILLKKYYDNTVKSHVHRNIWPITLTIIFLIIYFFVEIPKHWEKGFHFFYFMIMSTFLGYICYCFDNNDNKIKKYADILLLFGSIIFVIYLTFYSFVSIQPNSQSAIIKGILFICIGFIIFLLMKFRVPSDVSIAIKEKNNNKNKSWPSIGDTFKNILLVIVAVIVILAILAGIVMITMYVGKPPPEMFIFIIISMLIIFSKLPHYISMNSDDDDDDSGKKEAEKAEKKKREAEKAEKKKREEDARREEEKAKEEAEKAEKKREEDARREEEKAKEEAEKAKEEAARISTIGKKREIERGGEGEENGQKRKRAKTTPFIIGGNDSMEGDEGDEGKSYFISIITEPIFMVKDMAKIILCLFNDRESLNKIKTLLSSYVIHHSPGFLLLGFSSIILYIWINYKPLTKLRVLIDSNSKPLNKEHVVAKAYYLYPSSKGIPESENREYSFSINGRLFIEQPLNLIDKEYNIIDYGGVPRMTFNPKRQRIYIYTKNGNTPTRVHEIEYFDYQRWNHFVFNYSHGTLDLFWNSKLIASVNGIMPKMTKDSIIVGENQGIHGGMKHLRFRHEPLTTLNIKGLNIRRILKEKYNQITTKSILWFLDDFLALHSNRN